MQPLPSYALLPDDAWEPSVTAKIGSKKSDAIKMKRISPLRSINSPRDAVQREISQGFHFTHPIKSRYKEEMIARI